MVLHIRLTAVLSLLFTLLCGFAAASYPVAVPGPKCSSEDIQFVRSHSKHPVYFCEFYNEVFRVLSPFQGLSKDRTTNACRCIKARSPAPPKPTTIPAPTGAGYGPGKICHASDITVVKNSFMNHMAFCKFYTAWSSTYLTHMPIPGLPVRRTENACQCILKRVKVPATTTSAAPFCASSPVTSLIADDGVSDFCWSVLDIPTPTLTARPETVVATRTNVDEVAITNYFSVTSTIVDEVYSTSFSTYYPTVCGANQNGKKKKRGEGPPQTPTYLSGYPSNYISSACACKTDLGTPPTQRVGGAVVTATAELYETKTTVIDKTTYFSVEITVSSTVSDVSTAASGVLGTATPATTLTASSKYYDLYYNITPIAGDAPLGSCACGAGAADCHIASYVGSCHSVADCATQCNNYGLNSGNVAACQGFIYDTNNNCTFLDYVPYADQETCGTPEGGNIIVGGVQD